MSKEAAIPYFETLRRHFKSVRRHSANLVPTRRGALNKKLHLHGDCEGFVRNVMIVLQACFYDKRVL